MYILLKQCLSCNTPCGNLSTGSAPYSFCQFTKSERITVPNSSLRTNDTTPNFTATATATHGSIDFHQWIDDDCALLFSHPKGLQKDGHGFDFYVLLELTDTAVF